MKKWHIVLALLIASTSVFAALQEQYVSQIEAPRRYGVERVSNYDPRVNFARIESTVYLEPVTASMYRGVGRGGHAPFYARGTARVKSSMWNGFPRAQVNIRTKDLESYAIYEGWVVDVDTGYRMSLGTFTTLGGGVGELFFNINHYLDPYDIVEVTAESPNDLDLTPGPAVLVGLIPSATYYDPIPKPSLMIHSSVKSYS